MTEAWEVLLIAFKNYLSKHGKRILSILDIIGQEYVKTEVKSLFPYHNPSIGYIKLMDAVQEVINDREQIEKLRKRGIEIILEEGEYYLRSYKDAIRKLIGK